MSEAVQAQASSDERSSASLIRGAHVILGIDEHGAPLVLDDGAVAQRNGVVEAIGPYEELRRACPADVEVLGSTHSVVFPGFVNAHHHVGLTPLQLGSPDMDLEPWIIHRIGARQLDPYLDTLYSAFEMIESGVTTVQHIDGMMFATERQWEARPSQVLRAYQDVGMRVSYSVCMLDQNRFVYDADERFLDRLNPQTREQVRRQLGEKPIPIEQQLEMGFDDVWDQWEGAAGGRIRIQLAPQGLQWCSDEALELLADKARERQVGLHMHLLETCAQRWYAANRCPEGVLRHLGSVGMLGSLLTLGHGVWLKDDDIEVMAESGTRLCYNPSSNLRLKSGIAPILPVTRAGVVVAIGIDEAGINDDRDMFQELRLAVTLQRLPGVGSRPLSTAEGFRMATENGAATTRFGSMLGVLSVGSAADVVVLDWEGICRPYLDPRSALMDAFVRRSRTSLTQMVMVGGEVIYKDGEFTRVDRNEALSRIATELTPPTSPEDDARRELADSLLDPVVEFYKSAPGQQALDPFYVFNSRE